MLSPRVAALWLFVCMAIACGTGSKWHKILPREAEMIAGDVTCRRSYCRVF